MADLKTTTEDRARMRQTYTPDGCYGLSGTYTQKLLDDLDTLLAENARLRAAEAEVERLRAALRAAADGMDSECDGWGDDARAALGEP